MALDYYNENADSFFRSTIGVDMSELHNKFLNHLAQGATILDLGCGSGRDSRAFLKEGYKVIAVDGSTEMVRLASQINDLNVSQMLFEDLKYDSQFDGIWACASLLHVPYQELGNIFCKVEKALKSDGILYVSFKYGDTERITNGRNFTDLDEPRLESLIAHHTNLAIVETWVTTDKRPYKSESWLNALIKK